MTICSVTAVIIFCTLCVIGEPEHNSSACGGVCVLPKGHQRQTTQGPLRCQCGPEQQSGGFSLVQ